LFTAYCNIAISATNANSAATASGNSLLALNPTMTVDFFDAAPGTPMLAQLQSAFGTGLP